MENGVLIVMFGFQQKNKMSKCEICGKEGFHKMSCPTQKVTVFIPTLEGDEAEEFIRKAESAERGTVDWSRQMKQMERILEKSRIANRKLKYGKGEAPKVKRSKDVEE
jgi:hypothetical protein